MTREITDVVALLVLPPAGPLLLLAAAAVPLALQRRRIAAALAIAAFGLLWVASLGVVGQGLIRALEAPPASPQELARVDAIVVLGAGRVLASPEYGEDTVGPEGLVRLRYGARLARATGRPLLVAGGQPYGGTLSEGETMARALRSDLGVAPRWIEDRSATTAENAQRTRALLEPEGLRRIALVTHAWHMRRAQAAFRKAGFEVVAAPTGFSSRGGGETRLLDWLPSAGGLAATRVALWELLGLAWYALKGAV